jgi:Tol biopolymer transport system component/predicted Ser/Thr protein kinase
MSLAEGSRLGPYEIVASIGAGGMGEVYKARDTRLERTVAIKVLPPHFVGNDDLRQRFEREAKTVSNLNHPHICTVHDVGHEAGVDYLVMEYIEGETLLDRLEKGPLPLGQALRHAVEIADALDKAHRSGVIHRDLKPGNVMLTRSGAKLLDFGLAKVTAPDATERLSVLATAERPLTQAGTLLGTFQYMAPEQLEGREVDARTDVFAFGAVLYEMVTGRRAFEGTSQASLVSSIMTSEPAPLAAVQPMTPPALERIVRTCLAKDPDDRWQSAHDLGAELRWIAEAGSQAGVPAPVVARRKSRERWAWVLVAALSLAAVAGGILYARHRPAVVEPTRFAIALDPQLRGMDWPRLSPDGRTIAFLGTDADGRTSIWLRPLSALEPHVLAGTDGAWRPFWSPDGRHLAFFVGKQLKKVPVSGGPPQLIADSVAGYDGSWGTKDVILFDGTASDPIRQVSATGGVPTVAATADGAEGESGTGWPTFLPDGTHYLYVASLTEGGSRLKVASLDSKEAKTLGPVEGRVEYSPSGHVLYVSQGTLLARPFSTRTLEFTGEPVPVAENVTTPASGAGYASFAVSTNGTLAYMPGRQAAESDLVWVDPQGKELGKVGHPGTWRDPALSPDGARLAVGLEDPRARSEDIWVFDLKRDVPTRLTFDGASEIWPVWSPDGKWIAFASNRGGQYGVFRKLASGAGQEELLYADAHTDIGPTDWSPDGKWILCTSLPSGGTVGIVALPAEGERKPEPLVVTAFANSRARFSPDGRWFAYQSNESGRDEVYVQPFPATGAKWQISTAGGRTPFWTDHGHRVVFLDLEGTHALSAALRVAGALLEVSLPEPLFERRQAGGGVSRNRWVPSAAGDRFLVNAAQESTEAPSFHVVLDWPAALASR